MTFYSHLKYVMANFFYYLIQMNYDLVAVQIHNTVHFLKIYMSIFEFS